ncbi:uncharacterized protein EAE98_000518 [Botrytis deweyae]|uniref:Uncharacterized protein n=1 Tax=Botrytis deweyae TaxID=2478750 RepID=A0ABQ7J309_9HELO|nr:uncharacterized protein EAE98_000518 [Botrytis deweyae]KAF7940391.1 hypothetical protein EAE98_000518 [Botrytis deweyae]
MGQRHQLFVIAKVNGRYRGLAAIHHQWLYGITALEACLNILKILQSPANRIALSHELRHAARFKEEDWSRKIGFAKVPVADIPFPFILTCLVVGAGLRAKDSYHARVHNLPFNLSFDGSDNNDGITVFDITELTQLRYCFVNLDSSDSDEEEGGAPPMPPAMTPLTGPQYLWGYYRKDDQSKQEKFKDLGRSFQALPLIDGRALHSAWPDSSWKIMVQDGGESVWTRVEQVVAEEEISEQKESNPVDSEISSLRASSLVKVLNSAIASSPSELPQILERASLLSDFYPTAKSKLYADPTDVSNSASARRILGSILRREDTIDLGPFELSTEQISEVLEEASKDPKDVISLSFSGNLNITESFLKEILIKFPRLETLYLLNTPQISLERKIGLLRGTTIQLYDTELLALPFVKKDDGMMHGFNKFEPRLIPLYGYIKPVINQMIIMACCDTNLVPRDTDGGLDIESMFDKGILLDNSMRDHVCIPFGEVNLKPSALITGIAQYVHYVMNQQPYLDIGMMNPPALNIAKQLAMPHTFEDKENSFAVGTISDYFDRTPSDSWSLSHRGGWWKKYSKIAPAEWTLVVIGETDSWDGPREECAKVRYAFVSAAPPTDTEDSTLDSYVPKFIIRDFRGFLDSVIPDTSDQRQILEIWNRAVERNTPSSALKLSGRQEVESLMRALVYPVNDPGELENTGTK